MIIGIGIDIVEMNRMEEIVRTNNKFVEKILTVNEYKKFEKLSLKRKTEFLAGRFACKEAFSKACGTGIGKMSLRDIEILSDEKGKPVVTQSPVLDKVHVSISHTDIMAIGQIIIEKIE